MNRYLPLLALICLPLLANAENGVAPERAQLESACNRWAENEQVAEEQRASFISQCVAGLEQELEETGSVDLE